MIRHINCIFFLLGCKFYRGCTFVTGVTSVLFLYYTLNEFLLYVLFVALRSCRSLDRAAQDRVRTDGGVVKLMHRMG